MTEVTVEPVYDGDPDAPDAVPDVIGARLTVQGTDPVLAATLDLPLPAAMQAWGRLGDFLRTHDPEGAENFWKPA